MRPLTACEVAAYDLVPAAIARSARVQQVLWLARGFQGMTLGRFILLRRDDDRSGHSTLLAHELAHVAQYAQLGVFRFWWCYLREYGVNLWHLRSHRQAYRAVSFEVEARAATALWSSQRPSLCHSKTACCGTSAAPAPDGEPR